MASSSKSHIRFWILFLIFIGGVSYLGYYFYGQFFSDDFSDDPNGAQVVVTIPAGSTTADIAEILFTNGVIYSEETFIEVAIKEGADSKLQAGSFALKMHQSAKTAIEMLLDPTNLAGWKITIPEGKTVFQIMDILEEKTTLTKEQILQGKEQAKDFLPEVADRKIEGWLFPATYIFAETSKPVDIFKEMIDSTIRVLESTQAPEDDWQEILIKASIVQVEVNDPEYYGKVARVVENRLADPYNGYMLGMDTVIAYGLQISAFDLTQEQLADASNPYNDRVNPGLPPTPISNPGEEVILAVINPPEGDWEYFCTVNLLTGETKFTASLDEFQEFSAEYQQWLADNPDFNE